MRLFHITSVKHSLKITSDEYLEVTESNIGAPSIMDFQLHNKYAAEEFVEDESDPLIVMVWNPKESGDVLSIPRAMLQESERRQRVKFQRLTDAEVLAELGPNPEKYRAKMVVDIEYSQEVDGKFGDVISDVDIPTEDLSPYGEHVGPDVVWLTRDSTPRQKWAIPPASVDWDQLDKMTRKDAILWVVDIPDDEVFKWTEWAFDQGINQKWYDALAMGVDEHENWYVVPRRIGVEEWVSTHSLWTGGCLWLPPNSLPEGQQFPDGSVKPPFQMDIPLPDSWVSMRLDRSK